MFKARPRDPQARRPRPAGQGDPERLQEPRPRRGGERAPGQALRARARGDDAAQARALLRELCEKLLANPVIEDYAIVAIEPEPELAVPASSGGFRNYAEGAPARVKAFYRENHAARRSLSCWNGRPSTCRCAARAWACGTRWRSSTRWSTRATRTSTSPRSSTPCRPRKRCAPMASPRWLVLTGLLHDLGKILCLFGEPQWAVVGDTFPVGCAFDARVVHADLFAENPDRACPRTRPTAASTRRTAGWTPSISPGGTTSTSTTCCASICPSKRST